MNLLSAWAFQDYRGVLSGSDLTGGFEVKVIGGGGGGGWGGRLGLGAALDQVKESCAGGGSFEMHSLSMAESDCQASSFYSRLQGGQGVCLNFYISEVILSMSCYIPVPLHSGCQSPWGQRGG